MASSRARLPKLCSSRLMSRVRVRSLSLRRKSSSNSGDNDQKVEFLGNGMENFGGENGYRSIGNKVMVVVDSSLEPKEALEWALSHTIQTQDTIFLLHVGNGKPSKKNGYASNLKVNLRAYELLNSMKNICQSKRPGMHVEVGIREEKEKGPIIVEEAKEQRVSLLILGQRERSIMWRWGGKRNYCRGAVEYCIQNSSCMTIAVRSKGKKLGGYLITTKSHKKFWLLA